MPKRVASLWTHLRVIATEQHSSFRRNVAAVASRGQHWFDFTETRFEPQTSRPSDERVSARPTGRSYTKQPTFYIYKLFTDQRSYSEG